jgi:Uma2 family endonuclease
MSESAALHLKHYASAESPVVFPSEEKVPESTQHLKLRTLLYQVLHHAFRIEHSIGCDQFVYWNGASPRRCLAPDAFVRLHRPSDDFPSWKTWERGAPELCVEIASRSDAPDPPWDEKLEKYLELGAKEIVRFDWRAEEGGRLRAWDRVDGQLIERVVEADRTACLTLGLHWVVVGYPEQADLPCLRLARDDIGTDILPTRSETEAMRATAEASRAEAEAKRAEAEASMRHAAERRLAEVEAELRRRGG